MIRIGIVGCGRILAAHLQGYRLLREAGMDDFRITALCARRAPDARRYVERGKGPKQRPPISKIPGDPLAVGDVYLSDFQPDVSVKVYTDYREMIAAGPIDAVNDFTTHALHHQVAAAAIERGKDLLVQKPLAVSVAAARRMCHDAEARELVLGVFENARNRPETRQLRWLFDSGQFGRLQMILMTNVGTWWAPDRMVADTAWRHQKVAGGGITLDMGVHQLNQFRHVAGEIATVSAHTAVVEPVRYRRDGRGKVVEKIDADADDTVFAGFTTSRGVVGNLCLSWAGHGRATVAAPGRGTVFYGSTCAIAGTEVLLDNGKKHDLAGLYKEGCPPEEQARHFPLGLSDVFALNQYDWLQAIRQRREPETSGWEGLADLVASFAILESGYAGRTVDVEEVRSGQLRDYQQAIDEKYGLL